MDTHGKGPGLRHIRRRQASIALFACTATILAAGVAACSSGSSSSTSSPNASGPQTITFAESGLGYPAKFAQAGWVAPLTQFNVDKSQFFGAGIAAGTFNNTLYAVPWFQ